MSVLLTVGIIFGALRIAYGDEVRFEFEINFHNFIKIFKDLISDQYFIRVYEAF